MSGYGFFIEHRNNGPIEHRRELTQILNEAHAKFDEILPASLEKVYNRYWKLISSTLVIDSIKKLFKRKNAMGSRSKANSTDTKNSAAD